MTSSVTGLGPRNLSSSKAAARSDSYRSARLKSVVVALSRSVFHKSGMREISKIEGGQVIGG